QRAALHALAQRLALNKLGGNEVRAIRLADFVNRQNVWMIEGRRGSRFTLKSPQVLRVVCQFPGQNFDSHLASEVQVFRQKNFSHAAGAELLQNAVMRNLTVRARFKRREGNTRYVGGSHIAGTHFTLGSIFWTGRSVKEKGRQFRTEIMAAASHSAYCVDNLVDGAVLENVARDAQVECRMEERFS